MPPPNWHFSIMAPIYDTIGGLINRRDPVDLVRPGPGDRILDVGGGTGLLRSKFDGVPLASWTVLDLNVRMMRHGKRKGRSCQYVQGSAYRLPFRTGAFERILITDALHHMGREKTVLTEAARVLRSGGKLIIEEFDPGTPIGRLTETAEWLAGMGSRFVKPERLIDIIASTDLEVERTLRHQYLYYIVASRSGRNR